MPGVRRDALGHDEEGLLRFKCHVGHAYSADSLEVSQSQSPEAAPGTAGELGRTGA